MSLEPARPHCLTCLQKAAKQTTHGAAKPCRQVALHNRQCVRCSVQGILSLAASNCLQGWMEVASVQTLDWLGIKMMIKKGLPWADIHIAACLCSTRHKK